MLRQNALRSGISGFTLIELLVVIAVIALLLSILVPSLALVKRKAAAAVCLVNTKNLALGWYMYQGDNDGRIMSSNDDALDDSGTYVGWIGVPRDASDAPMGIAQVSPPVTDEDEIRGIEKGALHEYMKSPKVYHCPMDNIRFSLADKTKIFVSYGIPTCLYGDTLSGSGMYNTQIKQFHEITSPGRRYVFVESAEYRNWNMNHHFILGAPEYTGTAEWAWWGPMAVNHGDSGILGFCDGHSEIRQWRDPYTKEHVEKLLNQGGGNYGWGYPPPEQQSDISYIALGWPYRYKL